MKISHICSGQSEYLDLRFLYYALLQRRDIMILSWEAIIFDSAAFRYHHNYKREATSAVGNCTLLALPEQLIACARRSALPHLTMWRSRRSDWADSRFRLATSRMRKGGIPISGSSRTLTRFTATTSPPRPLSRALYTMP